MGTVVVICVTVALLLLALGECFVDGLRVIRRLTLRSSDLHWKRLTNEIMRMYAARRPHLQRQLWATCGRSVAQLTRTALWGGRGGSTAAP